MSWLAGADRLVRCAVGPTSFMLEVEGIATFTIASDGGSVVVEDGSSHMARDDVVEVLLGPALLLSFALRGRFCLHASAVATARGVSVFIGDSGSGKSTLARLLPSFSERCIRVADDLLVLSHDEGQLWCWPHYPQLGLRAEQEELGRLPERLRIASIFSLADPPPPGSDIEVAALTQIEALPALVRQTVAASLFDRRLLREHLDFATETLRRAPMLSLSYPRELSALEGVLRIIDSCRPARPGPGRSPAIGFD